MRAYAVCIGVTLECRRTESEMIGDGWGCADKADEAYHDICTFYENLCRYVVCSKIVFFHSFCTPEQSWVFIHNIDILHQ